MSIIVLRTVLYSTGVCCDYVYSTGLQRGYRRVFPAYDANCEVRGVITVVCVPFEVLCGVVEHLGVRLRTVDALARSSRNFLWELILDVYIIKNRT